MLLGIADFVASTLWRGRANRKQAKHDAALRERGVLAPAVVIRAATHQSRSNVDGRFIRIDYTVDVHPDGGPTFRADFSHWSDRVGYTAIRGEIVGEAGTHIWVTYDPADPADMIFEYSEDERVERLAHADLDRRRVEFNARSEPLHSLRADGLAADAVIVEVDDLELPYPARNGRAMVLHVDVDSPAAGSYRATIPALITDTAMAKYSAGRRVFVRHDPSDPARVVLDADRNRTLPD